MRLFSLMRQSGQALAIAALFVMPLTAKADAERDARLALAQDYVNATIEDLDVSAMVRTMYQPVLDQVRASGQVISEEQVEKVGALYLEHMAAPLVDLMRGQADIMADLFTMQEIEDLYAFYQTPTGRAIMQKLPELTAAQMPMINDMVMGSMGTMMPALMEILDLN